MKRLLAVAALFWGIGSTTVFADGLKSVLSHKLAQPNNTPGMVNIDAIHAPAKRKVVKRHRSRSPKAVVAVVNGRKLKKRKLDAYLSKRTHGKIKDFDLLPKKQRIALIREMMLPSVIAYKAKKALSKEEQEKVFTGAWMAKSIDNTKVSDEELNAAYDTIVAQAKAQTPLQQVPPLKEIKTRLRRQVAQQKVIAKLMEGVEVRVAQEPGEIAGYIGMLPVEVKEANEVIKKVTHTQKTWDDISPQEKIQLLQMIAPSKMVTLAAKNDLTKKEKQNALSNYWIQQQLQNVKVSEKEIKRRYAKLKKQKRKSKKKKLPSYDKIKESLKMQIANEKFMKNLLKTTRVKLK